MKKILFLLFPMVLCIQALPQNKFYVKGGLTLPTETFFGDMKLIQESNNWDNYSLKAGNIDVGSMFYIEQLNFVEQLKIGINVDYLSADYMSLVGKIEVNNTKTRDDKQNIIMIGSKIGPVVSYSPSDWFTLDGYFKVNPIWYAGYFDVADNDKEVTTGYQGFEGMKYSLGINTRFEFFMLGFEFNPGRVKMKDYDRSSEPFGNIELVDDDNASFEEWSKTPVNTIKITLGFCF